MPKEAKEEIQMEDPEKEEVKSEETPLKETPGDEEESFSDFFRESATDLEKDGKKPDEKKVQEKEAKAEKDTEEKEESKDSDELGDRGQEILDQEEEEVRLQEEEEVRLQEEKAVTKKEVEAQKIPQLTAEGAKIIMDMIPEGRFPDIIKVGDMDVDIKGYLEDNPEVALISNIQNQEYLMSLFNRGILITRKQAEAEINKRSGEQADELFGLQVMLELQNMEIFGVDLAEISESKELKEWGGKQKAPIKALFRSPYAKDYAKVIARYLNDSDLIKARNNARNLDKKALKAKEEHDETHSMTLRGRGAYTEATIEESDAQYSKDFREAITKLEQEP